MSGETNRLIALANDIMEEPTPREMDVLVSTGEQVTIALLSMALQKRGCDARSYTGSQVRILTDSRSEEHTSELQSRPHLVCRLLLEKKKKKTHTSRTRN